MLREKQMKQKKHEEKSRQMWNDKEKKKYRKEIGDIYTDNGKII